MNNPLPTIPDDIVNQTTNLANAFARATPRPASDFLGPLLGVITVLWGEVERQRILNVYHPLTTETLEALQRATTTQEEAHDGST